MNLSRLHGHGSSILVATVSSAFGVMLLSATGVLTQLIYADSLAGSSDVVGFILSFVAWVFIAIAMYVGAVVTANTFATIIAGRVRTIALMRLLGSTARAQRRAVTSEGLVVGIVGGVLGAVVGVLVTFVIVRVGIATGGIADVSYTLVSRNLVLPVIAVVLTTWAASWVGSRRVLTVSPMAATGTSQEASVEQVVHRRGRTIVGLILFVAGTGLLVLSIVIGLYDPRGVLVGVIGGLVSFSGVVLEAGFIMPRALRLTGRLFGGGATARLAAENAVRYPERATRMTIGLVIGVTLVTTFAVAMGTFQALIDQARRAQPEVYAGTDTILTVVTVVFSVIIGFSALIAAIGLVNNISLGVLQRTRELGLLRALGFSVPQVRRMVLLESAALTLAALIVGLVLGIAYGWAGAQSMFGGIQGSPGVVVPTVPITLVVALVVAAAGLTAVASIAPSRRATRVSPVSALAVD